MRHRALLLAAIGLALGRPLSAAGSLPTPVLTSPANGATDVATGPMLDWATINTSGAIQYRVFVHESKTALQAIGPTQVTCSGCKVNALTSVSMFRIPYSNPLLPKRQYYWMVRAGSSSAGSLNSQIWGFKTGDSPIVVSYYPGLSAGGDYYVVTVRLETGARVEPYLGSRQTTGNGVNCLGPDYSYYQFSAKNVAGFISGSTEIANARVALSGSFHDNSGRPAFPLKVRSQVETYGSDCPASAKYQGHLRMLEIRNSESRAYVEPFDLTKFKSSTIAPNVIVGFDPDYLISSTTGRHYACVKDASGGGYRTLLFLVSDGMTNANAKSNLVNQGCLAERMIQLDGSTVAQLSEKVGTTWQHKISFSRQMPQMFAIFDPG